MGLFGLFTGNRIDEGIKEYGRTEGAVLLDVRTSAEYAQGHIENSVNIPLDEIEGAIKKIPDTGTPIFVYCHSGARSGRAVSWLKQQGYRNVKNIGGIIDYHGKAVLQ